MDTMKLLMATPNRINILQLSRYGCFSEQTYRNLFKNEKFDGFAFNTSIISQHLTGRRKAIAIVSSYMDIRHLGSGNWGLAVPGCINVDGKSWV